MELPKYGLQRVKSYNFLLFQILVTSSYIFSVLIVTFIVDDYLNNVDSLSESQLSMFNPQYVKIKASFWRRHDVWWIFQYQ